MTRELFLRIGEFSSLLIFQFSILLIANYAIYNKYYYGEKMNKLLVAMALLTSLLGSAHASECEQYTYTKTWIDYDSSWNDSCENFIKAAMKENGCSTEDVYFSPIRMTQMTSGSELMCIYKGKNGIYQVMASQMAEPHRAVVLYSRWD